MITRIHKTACALKHLRSYATSSSTASSRTAISTKTTPSPFFTQRFKKITAYPFNVDPWHAKALMDLVGKMVTTRFLSIAQKSALYIYVFTKDPDDSFISKMYSEYLKSRYSKSGELPTNIKAIYYPAWRIWSAFQLGTAGKDGVVGHQNVIRTDTHLPGTSIYPELTQLDGGFRPPAGLVETAPLANCLDPFGMEVHCSPFTISPFAPWELAKSSSDSKSRLTLDDMVVLPSYTAIDIYAAFPVMYPYYTSEYTYPARGHHKEQKFQLYVSAWGMVPRLAGALPGNTDKDTPGSFIDLRQITGGQKAKYLSSIPALRTDDDTCIRPMKIEELEPIIRYLKQKSELSNMEAVSLTTWPQSQREEYLARYEATKARTESYKPSWWEKSSMANFGPPPKSRAVPLGKKVRPTKAKSRSRPI